MNKKTKKRTAILDKDRLATKLDFFRRLEEGTCLELVYKEPLVGYKPYDSSNIGSEMKYYGFLCNRKRELKRDSKCVRSIVCTTTAGWKDDPNAPSVESILKEYHSLRKEDITCDDLDCIVVYPHLSEFWGRESLVGEKGHREYISLDYLKEVHILRRQR